jgi:hypothetical protein
LVVVYVVGALDAKTRFNLMSSLSIKSTKWTANGLVSCRLQNCAHKGLLFQHVVSTMKL